MLPLATPPPPMVAPRVPALTLLAGLPPITFGLPALGSIRNARRPLTITSSALLSVVPSLAVMPPPMALPPCTNAPPTAPVASAAQVHALPLHFGIWLVRQAVLGNSCVATRLIVPVVVIGPPLRPVPVPTLVTVPLPLPTLCHCRLLPSVPSTLPAAAPLEGDSLACVTALLAIWAVPIVPLRLPAGRVAVLIEPVICAPPTVADAARASALAACRA